MTGLAIDSLRKSYGSAVALDGVSITLAPGEFVALLGPSGCGKTTTLRSVAGFVEPDSGTISLDGAPLTGLAPHRRNIGVVFQSYALFPHMTAAGNVGFGLKMRNVAKADMARRVEAALALVGLSRFADRYPSELSGGQQQRVALARALVIEPAVLLLDEPLSNLDAGLRAEMRDEIARLTDRLAVTTLFVTHDQAEALAMSDRVAVMDHGRIVEAAPPEQLAEAPAHAFTARFLGGRTVLEGRAEPGEGGPVFAIAGGPALPIADADAARRPTHLVLRAARLTLGASPGAAALPVTVEEAVFLGDTRQITVRAGEARITVHAPAEAPAPRPGAALTLAIPPEAMRLIADPPAAARAA
jgi:putative spermidine/putrescine transport system ATP-binding protein